MHSSAKLFILFYSAFFLVNKQTKNKHDKTKVAASSPETATAAEAATRTRGKMLYDKKKIIKRGENEKYTTIITAEKNTS